MIVENNNKLEGYLVGLGKGHKDGSIDFNWLDKPIHNRITSGGLDFLYKFSPVCDHSTDQIGASDMALWTYVYDQYNRENCVVNDYFERKGAISFASYGSGTTATSFTDTALVNELSAKNGTLMGDSNNSSQQFIGTRRNSNGNYSMRMTYKFPEVSETTTINEIGIWGGYTNQNTTWQYVLFARIVLDTPVVLSAGEYLICTYQLNVSEAYADDKYEISNFFNLLDSNGNTLKAYKKNVMPYQSSSTTSWNNKVNAPCIQASALEYDLKYGYGLNQARGTSTFNIKLINYATSAGYSPIMFYTTDADFPTGTTTSYSWGGNNVANYASDGSNYYYRILPYFGEGTSQTNKYRDIQFVMYSYCPNMSGNPDAYVDIKRIAIGNMCYRLGYYDNGTWVSQSYRKYANKYLAITYRMRYSTSDTTSGADITPVMYRYLITNRSNSTTKYLYSPYNDVVSNHRSCCFYKPLTEFGETKEAQVYYNGYWYNLSGFDRGSTSYNVETAFE